MRRRAASSLFIAVVASAVLAACGADPGATAPAATATPSTASIASPASNGTSTTSGGAPSTTAAAPDSLQFSADLVGGGQLDLRKYAGQTLALWFWAPT